MKTHPKPRTSLLNGRMKKIALVLLVILGAGCSRDESFRPFTLDELRIEVRGPSREIAYTNKEAGVYYTETNGAHRSGWQGWRIRSAEVMEDYLFTGDTTAYDKAAARRAEVYPDKLTRYHKDGTVETVTLVDSVNALAVELIFREARHIGARAYFSGATMFAEYDVRSAGNILLIAKAHQAVTDTSYASPAWIAVTIALPSGTLADADAVGESYRSGSSFSPAHLVSRAALRKAVLLFAAGNTPEDAADIAVKAAATYRLRAELRRTRMEHLLNTAYLRTGNERYTKALAWARLSLDALVMNQRGKGIFAGLPWFDNYWGRDTFISFPGALLAAGRFNDARDILRTFAAWQNRDEKSPDFGRIPNLVTVGSLQYNTADGTPRFVLMAREYVIASGDTAFAREIFPAVVRSIEGALRYRTDEAGFLTHGEADTWMDSVGPEGPWTARGNRANDVQYLWYSQLADGAWLARLCGEPIRASHWQRLAYRLRDRINKRFVDFSNLLVYDHLNAPNDTSWGLPDTELRPNQLFAFPLLSDSAIRLNVFKTVTERLVYPWGVGSLAQEEENFHPYHQYPPYYVKDAAYHTGIVWTWLAGVWSDAAVSFGLADLSYQVTENMTHQIVDQGAVGTMSELLDAWPRSPAKEPELSGTFSQAWSLAEYLRVAVEDYCGVSVDVPAKSIKIAPRMPSGMKGARVAIPFGSQRIYAAMSQASDILLCEVDASSLSDSVTLAAEALFDDGTFTTVAFSIAPHGRAQITVTKSGARVLPEPTGGISIVQEMRPLPEALKQITLAQPSFRTDVKALTPPSFDLLDNAVIKRANPAATMLADAFDPEGDDNGTMSPQTRRRYVYPQTPHLKPGSLDITRFTFSRDDSMAYVTLALRNLSDPGWHPEYGFQLTFVAIAIDTDGDGSTGSKEPGANSGFRFENDFGFDRIIYVGGGVRIADATGRTLADYIPAQADKKNPLGNLAKKTIRFAVQLHYLGTLGAKTRFAVLAGAQDDHGGAGIGEFRSVERTAGEWTGGGKKSPRDPNVYDYLYVK